jgi:hypothetical protein
MQDEGVVIGQRQRIGGQFVQLRILEAEWRLDIALHLLLAQDIGDVVGAECAGGMGLVQSGGDGFWAIFPNQREQFSDLTRQRAVGIGQALQVEFASGAEPGDQALLGSAALRRGPLGEQFFLEALGAEHLAALPATGVGNNLLLLVVDGERAGVGLDGEPVADKRGGTQ